MDYHKEEKTQICRALYYSFDKLDLPPGGSSVSTYRAQTAN